MGSGVTTTQNAPWNPSQPYLIGGTKDTIGVIDAASKLYMQNGQQMPAHLQGAYNNVMNMGMGYGNSTGSQMINQNAQSILSGAGAPNITAVGPVSTTFTPQSAAQGSGAAAGAGSAAFNLGNLGMGNAPKDAFTRMLSGRADTTTLDPVVNSATRRLTDNFNEQVMPAINQGATAAGQYGSSRQGIAQGLAAKGLAQSMGDMTGNMYNSAYNQAQNMMQGAAGQLGGYSTSIANQNAANATQASIASANNATQASLANAASQNAMNQFNAGQANSMAQFNANLGLQNNSQAMQNYNNNLNAFNTASGALQNNANMGMNLGMGAINAGNQANNYGWQQLQNYQGSVIPIAGMGTTNQTPYYNNTAANVIGGIGAGIGLYNTITGGK